MTEPSEAVQKGEEIKTQEDEGKASVAWYRRPATFGAAAVAVALFVGSATAPLYRGADTTPKRWVGPENIDPKPCFTNLTTINPSPGECVHSRSDEQKEMPLNPYAWVKPHVAVYSTPAPPHLAPTLRDLGDVGQAEAISFLERDSGLKGGALATLRDALGQSTPKAGEHDPFKFERVLIANVAKGIDWKPGDRMIWTRILVQPINFSFADYTVVATDNQTKRVTSIERTDSRKFSAELNATIPGMEGPKASLGPSSERTTKTSSDFTAQYEKLGIDILPDFMRIIRESETGGDAVGNTEVALTAVTDPDMIHRHYPKEPVQHSPSDEPVVLLVTGTHSDDDAQGEQPAGKKVKPIEVLPQVPVPHCALRARVWMLYEERKVDKGREFYDEAKQSVTLVRDAQDKQDLDLLGADEVSPAVWSLRLLSCKEGKCTEGEVLMAQPSVTDAPNPSVWRKVVFTDYGVAIRTAHWLRTHPAETLSSGYRLNFPVGVDGKTYTSLVPFKKTGDECKAPPPVTAMRAYLIRVAARRLGGQRYATADRQTMSEQ